MWMSRSGIRRLQSGFRRFCRETNHLIGGRIRRNTNEYHWETVIPRRMSFLWKGVHKGICEDCKKNLFLGEGAGLQKMRKATPG